MGQTFKPTNKLTKNNVEHKIMAIRYRKAWETLHARLTPDEQAKVKYAKEHLDEPLVDPNVGAFVKLVIELAEGNARL